MKESFIEKVKRIYSNGDRYGNIIIYDMCMRSDLNNEKQLSSKIWLIGRSYAASPERRSYKPSHDIKTASDGLGTFFDAIAKSMVQETEYKELVKILNKLNGKSYKYDFGQGDCELLKQTIQCVYMLNEIIRKASAKFDGVNNKTNENGEVYKCKNQISFCSKFLHFHCKNLIFIIDHYSFKGGEFLLSNNGHKNIKIEDDLYTREEIKTLRKDIKPLGFEKQIIQNFADDEQFNNDDSNKMTNYVKHVLRCYRLSCFIKQNKIKSSPRIIDTLLLKIKET